MRVVFDCHSLETGRAVGWNWMKHGLANSAPRRWARNAAVTFEFLASVER